MALNLVNNKVHTLRLKRGAAANLPAYHLEGEPYYTTDDFQLYLSDGTVLRRFPVKAGISSLTRTDGLITEMTLSSGRTVTITRDANGYIETVGDGATTLTITRDVNNFMESLAVT